MKTSPFERLLGKVPVPRPPAGPGYRDAADAKADAVVKAARADPENFFQVLSAEPSLIDASDLVWALGFVKDERVTPLLAKALRSKQDTVRWAAANGLARRRSAAVVSALVGALKDRSTKVRQVVVQALGKQRNPSAIKPLREALARASNQKVPYLVKLITQALERLEG
jgi:HEAT repeat protein